MHVFCSEKFNISLFLNMNDFTDLLNITYNNIHPQKGKILISQPLMSDGCFRRSVVLLTDYSPNGAIGFILNKWLQISLDDVMEDSPSDSQLSIGGPVAANTLHYLHTFGNIPDVIEIVNGIYWGGDFATIRKYLSLSVMKPEDIRFFLGYSGWTGGQLDGELKSDSWLVGDLPASQILRPSRDLWHDSVNSMGDEYKQWANFPENPILN